MGERSEESCLVVVWCLWRGCGVPHRDGQQHEIPYTQHTQQLSRSTEVYKMCT